MQKRYDLSAAAILESRDGGVSKGGLIKNGFAEMDGAGERWDCMRPALGTHANAPITGTGQGLFLWGTTLLGMYIGTAGTSTSATVSI